jgi:hypothetical protein
MAMAKAGKTVSANFIPNFVIAYLPILVQCKTKGVVGAVCALLLNWQLGASLPITVRDGAVTLKGLSHEIDFKNFDQTLKNLT